MNVTPSEMGMATRPKAVRSPGMGVQQWWYTIWLPLLALLIAARSVQQLLRLSGAR